MRRDVLLRLFEIYKRLNDRFERISYVNLQRIYKAIRSKTSVQMDPLSRDLKRNKTMFLKLFQKYYQSIKNLIDDVYPIDARGHKISYEPGKNFLWGFPNMQESTPSLCEVKSTTQNKDSPNANRGENESISFEFEDDFILSELEDELSVNIGEGAEDSSHWFLFENRIK